MAHMSDTTVLLPDDLEPSTRGTLEGHGSLSLAWSRWEHPAPKGRVVILHGYGEHGERYRHTAFWLHELGWSVSALDQRGFGRSGGPRGDADGIRVFVDDFVHFLRQERHHDAGGSSTPPRMLDGMPLPPAPEIPMVVLGHSFGGLVALLTLLWHPDAMEGCILSSPAVGLRPNKWLEDLAVWVLGRLAPHFQIQLKGDKSLVCSDPILVQRYWADPLCHKRITPAFVRALQEGRQEALPFGAELDRPVLLLESGDDTVADPDISEDLWKAVPAGFLTRHRLEGFRHEIFHDRRRREAQARVEAWLDVLLARWTGRSHDAAVTVGG